MTRLQNGASVPQQADIIKPDLQSTLEHYDRYVPHDGKYLCLVHEESNPSMAVDLADGVWFCHSCGEGGDSLSLIMKKENLDFRSAVEFARATPGLEGSTLNRSSDPVPEVLGRSRPGVSRGSRPSKGRGWQRPW